MATPEHHKTGTVKSSDGVALAYDQRGDPQKQSIVFVNAWYQTALQWRKQYEELAKDFHITTYDHRGHGESENTDRGYRVSRLAADLNDLLVQLKLRNVTLVGHSMGCSVIWSYWDLFAGSRANIRSIVLVDQSSCMLPRPGWSEEMAKEVGTVFSEQTLKDFVIALQGPDPRSVLSNFVPSMFTGKASPKDVNWTLERNMLMDSNNAATLLLDHVKNDWRDVIKTINVPTLAMAATGSFCPMAASQWTASNVEGAQLAIMKEEDGGSHFMFWEGPATFNAILRRFVEKGEVAD